MLLLVRLLLLHQRRRLFCVRFVLGCFGSYACSTVFFIEIHIDFRHWSL